MVISPKKTFRIFGKYALTSNGLHVEGLALKNKWLMPGQQIRPRYQGRSSLELD